MVRSTCCPCVTSKGSWLVWSGQKQRTTTPDCPIGAVHADPDGVSPPLTPVLCPRDEMEETPQSRALYGPGSPGLVPRLGCRDDELKSSFDRQPPLPLPPAFLRYTQRTWRLRFFILRLRTDQHRRRTALHSRYGMCMVSIPSSLTCFG